MMDAYQKPVSSVQKAVRLLIEHYEVFFVAPPPFKGGWTEIAWLSEYINVPVLAAHHLHTTP